MANPTKTIICCGACEEQTGTKCGHCFEAVEVELTDAEVAQMEADRIAAEEAEQTRQEALSALAALKASAKAKLVAGQPLTEEEAATLVI